MIQVAVPSRENVETYAELGEETDRLVGEINGRWGTPEWTPLVYIRRGLPAAELAALYATADVAWVAPLRDGMNLVAKEYVACKEGKGGVLVLSEFAGAAAELGEALQVNPYDEERTAEAVARALTMPDDEQRQRMAAMHQRVRRHDVFAWGERFLESLRDAAGQQAGRAACRPPLLNVDDLLSAYASAGRRLLLFDYDGTLVGFARRPSDAVPPPTVIENLRVLAADDANVVAVVSGRSSRDLDRWFGAIAACGSPPNTGRCCDRRIRRTGKPPASSPRRTGSSASWPSSNTSPTARRAASSRRRTTRSFGTTAASTLNSAIG